MNCLPWKHITGSRWGNSLTFFPANKCVHQSHTFSTTCLVGLVSRLGGSEDGFWDKYMLVYLWQKELLSSEEISGKNMVCLLEPLCTTAFIKHFNYEFNGWESGTWVLADLDQTWAVYLVTWSKFTSLKFHDLSCRMKAINNALSTSAYAILLLF